MNYIEKNLLQKESILYKTQPHRIAFLFSILLILLALIISIYLKITFPKLSNWYILGISFYKLIIIFTFLPVTFTVIQAYITHQSSEYSITDKRMIMKTGWIQRHIIEIFLIKIEEIHVEQNILGRMLNYGNIIIIGTGGSKECFLNIPRPLKFRNVAEQAIDNVQKNN